MTCGGDKRFLPPEPYDPLLLTGEPVEGDPEIMLVCLIEEYVRIGWDTGQIQELFENPFFQATYAIGQRFGMRKIQEKIREVITRFARYRIVCAQTPVSAPVHLAEGLSLADTTGQGV